MGKSIASGAKRGSVGNLILEALSTGDKYGWEIMKAIEEKSKGEYILKEPSLYSSLKRMETSGYITSYWQDSDIGGRRHYYNITEAGIEKLNKSSIKWDKEKEFVTELFSDDKKESSSPVNSSINLLNKSMLEAQKTVNKLAQNEKNISRFIAQTEKEQQELQNKNIAPVVEQPTKAGDKLILPTINPLQQDLFTAFSQKAAEGANKEKEQQETPQVEPSTTKVENTVFEEQTTSEENALQTVKQEENKEQRQTIEQQETIQQEIVEKNVSFTNENLQETQTNKLKEQTITENEALSYSNTVVKEATIEKKQKYTAIPTTYVQVPMFEEEKPHALSGIYIEKEPLKPAKPTIQHIRNLATEKEFLDIKNAFKNKHKSFLNRTVDYNKTFLNKTEDTSSSIYGALNLNENEVYETKGGFNNLGLEETRKAKEQAHTKQEPKQEEEKQPPHSPKFEKEQEKQQNQQKAPTDPMDEVDLKGILGELFTEGEEENTEQLPRIQDLPRINVSDNINISLRTKKKEPVEQPVYTTPVYTYNTNKTKQEQPEKDATYNSAKLGEEDQIAAKKQLKNFHENLSTDEYSSSLLEDIYFENLEVRTHKVQQKAPLMTTSYVSINKLNLNLSFALFVLMLLQIGATYIGLTNAGYVGLVAHTNLLFIGFSVLTILPVITTLVIYLFAPLRKKEVRYSLLNKLGNNFIILLIALVFIYAANLFAGMNNLNRADFIPTLILPAVLTINLLFVPIIKFILLKRKKYYL
jgi:PadR family transcriptional regulator PadR